MTILAHAPLPGTALGAAATTIPTFYAGFWRRLMAAAIDSVLMLALVVGMSVTAGVSVGQVNGNVMITKYGRTTPLSEIAKPHVVVTRDGPLTTTVQTTTATVGLQAIHSVVTWTTCDQNRAACPRTFRSSNLSMVPSPLAFALLFALWLLYASVLESSRLQATLGKLAMFIRVVDDEGSRTTLLRAFARNALKLISALPLCIGYLMSGWTPRKQALHDILARCTVEVARS